MCLYLRPLVTAEARILSLISPHGIFDGRCGTGTGLCSSGSAAVPIRFVCHFTIAPSRLFCCHPADDLWAPFGPEFQHSYPTTRNKQSFVE
jgi:hypothetical protein